MKFQFNLTTQTLKLVQADHSLVVGEERKFSYFRGRSLGFMLDKVGEHRILFTICQEKILALYQVPQAGSLVRYQREITRPRSGLIEIEFSEWDLRK